MEVQIDGLDFLFLKEIVDELHALDAVNERDLDLLDRIDMDDALHDHQHGDDAHAADRRDEIIAVAHGQAQTGNAPQRGGGGQADDFALGGEDRARAQEADAADDLRAQAAKVIGDGAAHVGGVGHIGDEAAFEQSHRTRAQTHKDVRSHAGGAVFVLALNADDRSDGDGHHDAEEGCLPHGFVSFFHERLAYRFSIMLNVIFNMDLMNPLFYGAAW